MKVKLTNKKIRFVIAIVAAFVSITLIVMPVSTIIVYEAIFSTRYETLDWMSFSVQDYEGLQMQRSDFESGGVTLAGYKYSKQASDVKGVVIIAHGMGGGGQNAYMPFADCFTSAGYLVFAYDARGNDNSGGDSVEGLPQGVMDLDSAICHVKQIKEYSGLPIMLFGHSWGGYSVGNVLCLHPDVSAAVIIAGFNESEDMLEYQSIQRVGAVAKLNMPYLDLYERIKFGGKYADISALEGMEQSEARVMIVHSQNDATVPVQYGYDKFYEQFGDNDRFSFVLYEDRGHDYLF